MRTKDFLLLLAGFAGMGLGTYLPWPSILLLPYTKHMMMGILFFAFLSLDFKVLINPGGGGWLEIALLSFVRMMAFPAAAFGLTSLLWPEWALPVLVLTAVSTGVSAPFFCQVLGGNAERMLQVVVVTSLLVPVCMPLTLQLLAGASIKVPFMHMFELLAKMIFIPLALAGLVRWLSPRLSAGLSRAAFPVSICFMLLINAGVFAMCVDLFKSQEELIPLSILLATAVALFAQVFGAGAALGTLGRMNPYTSMISLNFGNNLIAVIFAAQFFDGKAPLLAAVYTLPLFLGLISIRSFSWVQRLKISQPGRARQ